MSARTAAALAGCVVMMLGSSAVSAAEGFPGAPPLELGPCAASAALPSGARCGVFRVAEAPTRPSGRTLALKVVVTPARSRRPLEPVFFLPGGPGASATGAAKDISEAWMGEEHPIVFMDPPGSDPQTGLGCPSPAREDLQQDMAPLFSEGDAYWRACRDALTRRADLSAYTTPNYLADLDALRIALGYDKIDLFGGSFGTRAGLGYIHAYGPHVRAALLTGLSPLANRSPLFHAQAAQQAFDRLVADCKAEPACAAAFPDMRGDLDRVAARLRASPARVAVIDPTSGKPAEVALNADAFADSVRVMLYTVAGGRRLPLLLHRAAAGDLEPFAQAALENGRRFRHALKLGLTLSQSCAEDAHRIGAAEIGPATAGAFIGDTRLRGQLAACRLWPTGKLPPAYYEPFVSQVPTVIVSGALDPVTPPLWGEAARKSVPNSVHLITGGAHADVDACVAGIAAKVFREGSISGLDLSCMRATRLPPFDTSTAKVPAVRTARAAAAR